LAADEEPDSAWELIFQPQLHIQRAVGEIDVDGVLTDEGWRNAGRAEHFFEHRPGDQTKPPVETVAQITYDDDNLYVAYICYDDPATIRASYCERDRIFSDDNICLLIDTYGNAVWAYELNVNPYGIQGDLLWSQYGGEDSGFDIVWESAGQITDSGYQLEMAIPFSSLRFPDIPQQTWRIDFWRNHPRDSRRQYSWAAYDRNEQCWPCQWGTITGIENVRPGKGIEIMPSFVGHQAGTVRGEGTSASPYDFANEDPDGEFSINAKYAIKSNLTVEATINPDFSQIEADPPQIDVNTTTALSFAERRPFFQEGSDLYQTVYTIVYTRSINDPQFAAKVVGRLNKTTLAFLSAYDELTPIPVVAEDWSSFIIGEKSLSNIFRLRQAFGSGTNIGLLVTDRRYDGGGSGTVLANDGSIRLNRHLRVDWQFLGSQTDEPADTGNSYSLSDETIDGGKYTAVFDDESYWGHGSYAGLQFDSRNLYLGSFYIGKSPTLRLANGYIRTNSRHQVGWNGLYRFNIDSKIFDWIVPSVALERNWNYDGVKKSEFIELMLEAQLKLQTSTHWMYTTGGEQFAGNWFDNTWNLHGCMHSNFSDIFRFGAGLNRGHAVWRDFSDPTTISATSIGGWIDFKPLDRLLIETSVNYSKADFVGSDEEAYEGYTARSRMNIQLNHELSFRLIVQYDDFYERWDIDPLVTYRLSPFSLFYIGSTYDYDDLNTYDSRGTIIDSRTRLSSRQFFMKLQYLFQV
jgi:hypothetical protein